MFAGNAGDFAARMGHSPFNEVSLPLRVSARPELRAVTTIECPIEPSLTPLKTTIIPQMRIATRQIIHAHADEETMKVANGSRDTARSEQKSRPLNEQPTR